MPAKKAIKRARKDKREGKSASTQAGEFVREEIEHVREGKHGARSTGQAIAIGLSEARRAGVRVPKKGSSSGKSRKSTKRKTASRKGSAKTSRKRARASNKALKREGHSAASKKALSKHARKSARQRTATDRSRAAKKAARTKGAKGRSAAARKAARTRAKNRKR